MDMASACPQFGTQCGLKPARVPGHVGVTKVHIDSRPAGLSEPKNCRECRYLAPAQTVRQSLGWPMPLCLARGDLIPPKRMAHECKGCQFGFTDEEALIEGVNYQFSTPSMADFEVLPVYGEVKQGPEATARSYRAALEDSRNFKTDAPVSEAVASEGIRAWRRIEHPHHKGKSPLFLPVFDPDFFPEEERLLIPETGDEHRPELYVDYANIIHSIAVNLAGVGTTPVLIGPAGIGKTEAYHHLAWLCQMPYARISITASSEVYDVIGKHLVEPDPTSGESITTWVDGRLSKRWGKPGVCLVDEPNAGPNDLWQLLRPLTDNAAQLVLDQDRGQILKKHPWCLLGMAMNPAWDPRYIGVNELNEADGNRLGAKWVDYPPEEVERDIIILRCEAEGYSITAGTLDTLIKIGAELRKMADPINGGQITVSWGPRLSIRTALYTRFLTLPEAVNMTIGDRLDPDQRELVMGVVKDHESAVKS
jgi:hypothetical protein